ncbi:hypothetical protein HY642_00855 [Candidatus Woesearchaeota archaeon]|nr:hypothetical protein [Candidatus Woesearchaeota archaeon]
MSRAQIISQVFVLILGSMVFILILLYGYKAIFQISDKTTQVALIQFETTLKEKAKNLAVSFGKVQRVELTLPSKFRTLCIADPALKTSDKPASVAAARKFGTSHPSMDALCCDSQNVFLIPPSPAAIKLEDIEVSSGYFCMNFTGTVRLRMQGKGSKTLIGPWIETTP